MNPEALAVIGLTFLTLGFIYLSEKRDDKHLTFEFWWNSEGAPLLFIIGIVWLTVVSGIDARTNFSISGYPPDPRSYELDYDPIYH